MNKKEVVEELEARGIEYPKQAKKADLVALLEQDTAEKDLEVETETTKHLQIPEERVTSRYPEEQEKIDEAYDFVNANLDKSKTWLIREVQKIGVPTSYISKMLGAHYSFVHTVVTNASLSIVEKRTKSDDMREYFKSGLTVAEVAKLMNAHYSYVHGVHKRWKEKEGKEGKVEQ